MVTTILYGELPISEQSAFAHLRVGDNPADRVLILDKLEEAIAIAEDYTNRHLRQQTILVTGVTDHRGWLMMPFESTVQSVEGYEKWEYNDFYHFVNVGAPRTEIAVTALVGYGVDNFPRAIRSAVMLILGTLYEFDSDEVKGRTVAKMQMSAFSILERWRVTPYKNA